MQEAETRVAHIEPSGSDIWRFRSGIPIGKVRIAASSVSGHPFDLLISRKKPIFAAERIGNLSLWPKLETMLIDAGQH